MSHAQIRRQLLAIAGAIAAVLVATPAALAGPGDFYSSFEDGDPAPTWTDTVDTDQDGNERAAGVTGPTRDGLPGDVTDKVIAVRANGENSEARTTRSARRCSRRRGSTGRAATSSSTRPATAARTSTCRA